MHHNSFEEKNYSKQDNISSYQVMNIIRNSFSWVIFTGATQFAYSWRVDSYWSYNIENSLYLPGVVIGFLDYNTGSKVIGEVPYFNERQEVVTKEYFISCGDNYCASFYWNMRVRNGSSPTLRLVKILGSTNNQYFHGQYAMRLSDGRVVSLDPLDTDITDIDSLFKRLRVMSNPDITELTKLVHDRYYLSGGLTPIGAMHMDFWSGDEIFTGALEISSDTWNIPTRITGRVMDPNKSYTDKANMQVCYDAYERQLFYTWTTKPHGTIEHACGVDGWSNNDGTAMYVRLARLFGVVSFDQIMSRTTGVVFSESPWKMPCMTRECPEDSEFIYE